MKAACFAVFLCTFAAVAVPFWLFAGHSLHYDVGYGVNGEYSFSHTEDFSTSWRISITLCLAAVAASAATCVYYVARKLRSRDAL